MSQPLSKVLRLAAATLAVQAGFHGFTAALPVALHRAGAPDTEIGVIIGLGGLVQVPSAFLVGALIDRAGARAIFVLGAFSLLLASALLLAPWVELSGPTWPFMVARGIQGFGTTATVSAALSLVPFLVAPHRRGFGFALLTTSLALAVALLPPLSLAILRSTSFDTLVVVVSVCVVIGLAGALAWRTSFPRNPRDRPMDRRWRFSFRRAWLPVIAINVLFMIHWGMVVAFLPQRSEAFRADIGLFFAADGLALLAALVPAGFLTDRVRPFLLLLVGLAGNVVVVLMLAREPSTGLLMLTGLISGAAGTLVFTPTLVEIARRSDDDNRGSAVSLFAAARAMGLALGSLGGGILIGVVGFEAAVLTTLAATAAAAAIALVDPRLRSLPANTTVQPVPPAGAT